MTRWFFVSVFSVSVVLVSAHPSFAQKGGGKGGPGAGGANACGKGGRGAYDRAKDFGFGITDTFRDAYRNLDARARESMERVERAAQAAQAASGSARVASGSARMPNQGHHAQSIDTLGAYAATSGLSIEKALQSASELAALEDLAKKANESVRSLPKPLTRRDFKKEYNREVALGILEEAHAPLLLAHDFVKKNGWGIGVTIMTSSTRFGTEDTIPPAGRLSGGEKSNSSGPARDSHGGHSPAGSDRGAAAATGL